MKRDYKERDTVEYKLIDDKAESWGRVSWGLLKTLIVCVSIGIISIMCCIAIMYGGKLFCSQIDGQTTNTVQIPPAVPPSQTNSVDISTFKIAAICVVCVGLILTFIERLKAPPLLALKPEPKYLGWVAWAGLIMTAVGALMLAFA